MKREIFENEIVRLVDAFRVQPLTHGSIRIYWEQLKSIPDEDFLGICDYIIKTEKFFPSIATFKEIQREHFPIRIYIGELKND